MARTQSENYPEIRQSILDRSAALFALKGYPRSTIGDLAAACQMSRGALYHYFDSKEVILREILIAHLELMYREICHAAKEGPTAEARLRNAIHTMVMVNAGSRDKQIVLLNDLQYLDPEDRVRIVKKQKDIVRVVDRCVTDFDAGRKLDGRTHKANTMMLVGMLNYTYLWYDPDGPVGPEEYAQMVADTYVGGMVAG